MECTPHEKLEYIERVVKTHFSCLNVSYEISVDNDPYLCIFKQPISGSYLLPFLPMFYIIVTVDKEVEVSLKIITHHGKILKEVTEFGRNNLSEEKIQDFVNNLLRLKPCQGVNVLDYALKIDPYTFTYLYLVEQMGNETVVRSRQCLFVTNNDRTNCDMCSQLDLQYITRDGQKIELADARSVRLCLHNSGFSNSYDGFAYKDTDINVYKTDPIIPGRSLKHIKDRIKSNV